MGSKRDHEGEIYIDSRHGPISEEVLRWAGLPLTAGRGEYRGAFFVCSHCQATVYINPQRNRERAWCRKCDHYLCDACGAQLAATGACKTYKQVVDEVLEAAAKQGAASPSILLR
jgi:hypothetical protein